MSNSKFKIEFTLKQHTPIIHFQSDQSGATIRATELKPKLDKFLLQYFISEKIDFSAFLMSGQDTAFNYKVRIEEKIVDKGLKNIGGLPDDKLFMGNMGGGNKKQKYYRNTDTVVILKTFNTKLKDTIHMLFPNFMMQTNFGGGTSKGFGSYTVKDREITRYPSNTYKFTIDSSKLDDLTNSISYFYKMLKSGINECDKNNTPVFYGKSLLWKYVNNELKNTWDKKAIKQEFFSEVLEKQKIIHNNSDILSSSGKKAFLYRDLLGLSKDSDWKDPYNVTIKKEHKSNSQEKEIKRFKSPIRFKPVLTDNGYEVFYWGEEIPDRILNVKFRIFIDKNDFYIDTPNSFSIGAYLEFVSKQKLTTHINNKYQHNTNPIYKILNPIFNSIQKVKSNG